MQIFEFIYFHPSLMFTIHLLTVNFMWQHPQTVIYYRHIIVKIILKEVQIGIFGREDEARAGV